jgi:hypothetical protein
MSVEYFQPEILNSLVDLRSYFERQKEQEDILNSEAVPFSYNRWQIAWIAITIPFQVILSIFIECVAGIFDCIGAKDLAIRCEILGKHLLYDLNKLILFNKYGENYLAPMINVYDLSASDVFLQPSIPISSLNPDVQEITFIGKWDTLFFYNPQGVCRGITNWFLYLYLVTKDQFSDPIQHVQNLAQLFQNGAPSPAALLHSFCYPEESLLNLAMNESKTISFQDLTSNRAEALQNLENLQPGAYSVWLLTHRVVYLKIAASDNDYALIVDPSAGLITFSEENQSSQVLDYLLQYHDRNNARSSITFYKTDLKQD